MAGNQCSASRLALEPSLIDRPREVRVPSFGHDFFSENCYSGSITRGGKFLCVSNSQYMSLPENGIV